MIAEILQLSEKPIDSNNKYDIILHNEFIKYNSVYSVYYFERNTEMKINENFLTQEIDDSQVIVATGDAKFNGIVRSNKTAAEIVDLMQEETTRDEVIDKMCAKYDAPRKTIADDVDMVIATLRKIGAIDE